MNTESICRREEKPLTTLPKRLLTERVRHHHARRPYDGPGWWVQPRPFVCLGKDCSRAVSRPCRVAFKQTSRLTTCEDVAERPSDDHETGSDGVASYIDLWPSSRSVHRIKPKSCEADARPKQDFAKPCCHFAPRRCFRSDYSGSAIPRPALGAFTTSGRLPTPKRIYRPTHTFFRIVSASTTS
jgi:hypothetical protein